MRTGRNDRRGPARRSTVLAFLVAGMGSLSCVEAWNSLAADVRDAGRDAMDFASIIGGSASVTEPESIRRQGRWSRFAGRGAGLRTGLTPMMDPASSARVELHEAELLLRRAQLAAGRARKARAAQRQKAALENEIEEQHARQLRVALQRRALEAEAHAERLRAQALQRAAAAAKARRRERIRRKARLVFDRAQRTAQTHSTGLGREAINEERRRRKEEAKSEGHSGVIRSERSRQEQVRGASSGAAAKPVLAVKITPGEVQTLGAALAADFSAAGGGGSGAMAMQQQRATRSRTTAVMKAGRKQIAPDVQVRAGHVVGGSGCSTLYACIGHVFGYKRLF